VHAASRWKASTIDSVLIWIVFFNFDTFADLIGSLAVFRRKQTRKEQKERN
jgi:hypothetical protein